jgi:hypothetical protein
MGRLTFQPGDVEISAIDLIDIDGKKNPISIKNLIENVDIFESIMSPVIFGSILITDAIKLRESYALVNKCKIYFEFHLPSGMTPTPLRKFELLVTGIENEQPVNNGTAQQYTLNLCSIEILDNSKQLFTLPLTDKPINDYVLLIMKDKLNTKKDIFLAPSGTKGTQNVSPNQVKPFQSIDFLRRKAVSPKYKSSTFTFFENKMGFNFYPIEYMFERPEGKLQDALFFYDSDVSTDVTNINFRNILSYVHVTQQSTAKLVQNGALKNTTRSLDLRTRTSKEVVFDLTKEQDNFKFMGKNNMGFNSSSFEVDFAKLSTTNYYMIKSSSNPETYEDEKIGYSKAFTELLTQNILRIMTWGDSMLSAGYRIDCRLPAFSGLTGEAGKPKSDMSKLVSGEYLISSLRHMFTRIQGRYRYFNSMELIKGSFGESGTV